MSPTSVLNIMGRPLYWKGAVEETVEEPAEQSVDNGEEDAMEEDGMEEEEDEEFSDEDDEEVEMEQAADEVDDESALNVAAFKRLVDVMNHAEVDVSADSYACLQATTEDFLASLLQASSRSAIFAGRKEVTDDDVRFAQLMTQQKW